MDKKILLHKVVIVILAACTLFVGLFGKFKLNEILSESSGSVAALKSYINSNLRSGYRAVTDIRCGEMITDSIVEYSTIICSDVDQMQFITESDIGKVATVDIGAGMPIYSSMVSTSVASAFRERECSFIWLNTNLKHNDYVDVRVLFPNGEDYIVCSKKSIKNPLIATNNVFLWLTEDEILLLDAAIVDANLHGARIYVTRYLKPEIQMASSVTYSPSSDILRTIELDPNIVDRSAQNLSAAARNAMEARLQLFEEANEGFKLNVEVGDNNRYVEEEDTGVTTTTPVTPPAQTTTTDVTQNEVEYVDEN